MLRVSDKKLRDDVLRELRWDTRVGGAGILVSVREGVVTLTGRVPFYARKLAAQEAAHRVAGVLDVANEIEIITERRYSDTEIAAAVREAIHWDALVTDEEIHSTVSDGWVTLEGSVLNLRERDDAERAALKIRGVVGVVNKLKVRPPEVTPENLRAEIEDALERRADREAERLRIEVNNGTVDLFGRVHSWQERRAVVGSISHAPGVLAINDHLRIDPYF
jgi:osmotically-inducible protein OsmY